MEHADQSPEVSEKSLEINTIPPSSSAGARIITEKDDVGMYTL